MTTQLVKMLRLPDVLAARGGSKAKLYWDIRKGRFPPPAKQGRISVWPETDLLDEQQAVLAERDASTLLTRAVYAPRDANGTLIVKHADPIKRIRRPRRKPGG